ncbi:D-2-hydroxyacid dehydrogenase [Oceanobacillus neutriphilus]|uniref:2-hydroxyacid dehydrogenase n=1 Tax=Oceanobacillus neutriphilus TaxID=531815 RepID=A0ABQ2NQZ1_9BACI|nr:D-2-hydroxyacid dehydrogenase [Oceanobacillus neutriphilus]GGP09070.1 2-hydroxyacid dehydrogenase [Oceanobacillus neutriphilus]
MDIQKIMIVSPMINELKEYIEQYNLDKEIRYLTEDKLTEEDLEWADAFCGFQIKKNTDYSKVKWVHSLGAGVDGFLSGRNWDENVLLTRTVCSFGQRIGEYCLSYILRDAQSHQRFAAQQGEKAWNAITPKLLSEKKAVIYGTGEIGQKVAGILSVFGVKVYGISLSGKLKSAFNQVAAIDSHFSIIKEADYVVNTLPLTDKTADLFDKAFFEQVTEIGFINTGRGKSVDEAALIEAIEKEQVRFAVLDVFREEPLPASHPFWEHPAITITPHISAVTTAREAVECFIGTLNKVEAGQVLENKVDIQKGY